MKRVALTALAACLALGSLVTGCTEPVTNIDRTQGNLIRKADLEGEWYMLQTVTGVPPTSAFTFEGETGKLERVRWEVRQNQLIAFRSYPLVPGAESVTAGVPFDGTENPLAAYPIIAHVDVQREYNAQTGEQSNVIGENTVDRLWHEREYVRVDWSQSSVTNFDFIAPVTGQTSVAWFVQEEEGGPDAFYREADDDGAMDYFDVLGKMAVEPDLWGCIYSWYGWAAEDCASAQIDIRTSFAKVGERDYEPYHYDDRMMSRYGYFRTERYVFDEQRGAVESNRIYQINRHNIWAQSHDADGNVIPVNERTAKAVPYYLNADFPVDDPDLMAAARQTMQQWSDAGKRGVEAATGKTSPEVFVLCQNPVADDDHEACGERGFAPRMGDLRYSTLHWVDTETVYGLLGYGPSAVDPITGETISGKAYVYGSAVNTYASYAVDVIRFFNDELDFNTLTNGQHFADEVFERIAGKPGTARPDPALRDIPLERHMHARQRPERPQVRREELKPYDADAVQRRMDRAREAGATPMLMTDEVKRTLAGRRGKKWEDLPEDVRDQLDPTRIMTPIALKRMERMRAAARARSADFHDMIAPDIVGIVARYKGNTDYDAIWRAIRADIYASVAEHEVGHTVGLRHNFQGSYDALNYHDEYWRLREETLKPAESLADIYEQANLTDAQHEGLMRQQQYSSIMDYGYKWQNDLMGLGKYDEAAIIFGYTAGSYATTGAQCANFPVTEANINGDSCVASLPGYIEVFKKRRNALGEAGEILTREELGFSFDDPGLPSVTAQERWHYTTLALAFPSLDDFGPGGRELMPYADYLDGKAAGGAERPVRVPHMFCSDEWEGGLLSCRVFDQGADPFELTLSKVYDYRAYYPFVNFKRDRIEFDSWDPLFSYFWRVFLPMSDYFQSWYVAPFGFDPLFDRTYDLAVNTGFNLLAEVIATPPYGTYCEGTRGQLVWLDDEPTLQGDDAADPDCLPDSEIYRIDPGVGRRRFSTYDPDAGYLFHYKPQESGHYWASLAALWAMLDPDAFVVGVEGDAGTYAISYYDWFGDEFDRLTGDILSDNYARFAPRARLTKADDNALSLTYVPATPLYDRDTQAYYDAETGVQVPFDPSEGPTAGPVGLCDPCETDTDCAGHTGFLGGTYCQAVGDTPVCLQDCTNDPSLCAEGTVCDERGNCAPGDTIDTCEPYRGPCDADHLLGRCDDGATCIAGECVAPEWAPAVETEPTFSLSTDIFWYGFLFTTASFSTRFNDQLNVFRPGNSNQIEADPRYTEQVSFTDPISGIEYAAIQPNCEGNNLPGGPAGICDECTSNTDCAGFNGEFGGIWCQPLGDGTACLRDCTEDASLCRAGEICDGAGNCVPGEGLGGGECVSSACSPANPVGSCAEGSTCVDGECQEKLDPSNHCLYQRPDDTSAVQLIRRGNALAAAYNSSMRDWYTFQGDDAEDTRLARVYFRNRYRLTNHVDLIETLIATYQIFGRVY